MRQGHSFYMPGCMLAGYSWQHTLECNGLTHVVVTHCNAGLYAAGHCGQHTLKYNGLIHIVVMHSNAKLCACRALGAAHLGMQSSFSLCGDAF